MRPVNSSDTSSRHREFVTILSPLTDAAQGLGRGGTGALYIVCLCNLHCLLLVNIYSFLFFLSLHFLTSLYPFIFILRHALLALFHLCFMASSLAHVSVLIYLNFPHLFFSSFYFCVWLLLIDGIQHFPFLYPYFSTFPLECNTGHWLFVKLYSVIGVNYLF